MIEVNPEELILIGRVIRPHGLTGLLRIVSYAQSQETFLRAGSVFLGHGKNEFIERQVVSIKPHGSVHLVRLSGIDSIEKAEAIKGNHILIRKNSFDEKGEDEFFWHELIGMDVYLDTGEYVGGLKRIFQTGGNDVYVIENQEKEFLIPAIHPVIKEVNILESRMVISPLKGLLDI